MKPNPNLWSVDVTDRKNGAVLVALFICAATAGTAESKGRRYAAKLGLRNFTISCVAHKGTIDVF